VYDPAYNTTSSVLTVRLIIPIKRHKSDFIVVQESYANYHMYSSAQDIYVADEDISCCLGISPWTKLPSIIHGFTVVIIFFTRHALHVLHELV
jgi:hypothetical protein